MTVRSARERGEAQPADFRAVMSAFPSGVTIVTAQGQDGRPYGMTCSSLCSVALAPPTLLVCLREASPTLAAVLASEAFTVNLLHNRGRTAAELFASGAADRFDRIPWHRDSIACGPHLTEHAHAIADCSISSTTPVGDHVVVFGRVIRISRRTEQPIPLMYGLRRYSSWVSVTDEAVAPTTKEAL
jgi:flavin reductase (DIM6/NTAB) family NADH-FMN oxidoreductase RutF